MPGFVGGGGGSGVDAPFLTFQPGGTAAPGIVTDWADVDAYATAATTPWTLFVDQAFGAAEVPATADTDFNLLVTMRSSGTGSTLTILDGGKLRNIGGIVAPPVGIVCEAVTTSGVIIDVVGGMTQVTSGGSIANEATSLVPAIEITAASSILTVSQGAALTNNNPAIPLIEYTAIGGFQILPINLNNSGVAYPYTQNSIQADPTTTLLSIHDGTGALGDQTTFFAGTVVVNRIESSALFNWSNGTTAARPTGPSAAPVVGQPYFDTDLGIPIWWNGAAWVDATGTVV